MKPALHDSDQQFQIYDEETCFVDLQELTYRTDEAKRIIATEVDGDVVILREKNLQPYRIRLH